MAQSYKFRDMILGAVEGVCNEMAADGYSPEEIYKEGSRMYILFGRWEIEEDEVELSEVEHIYEALGALAEDIAVLKRCEVKVVTEETPAE